MMIVLAIVLLFIVRFTLHIKEIKNYEILSNIFIICGFITNCSYNYALLSFDKAINCQANNLVHVALRKLIGNSHNSTIIEFGSENER